MKLQRERERERERCADPTTTRILARSLFRLHLVLRGGLALHVLPAVGRVRVEAVLPALHAPTDGRRKKMGSRPPNVLSHLAVGVHVKVSRVDGAAAVAAAVGGDDAAVVLRRRLRRRARARAGGAAGGESCGERRLLLIHLYICGKTPCVFSPVPTRARRTRAEAEADLILSVDSRGERRSIDPSFWTAVDGASCV